MDRKFAGINISGSDCEVIAFYVKSLVYGVVKLKQDDLEDMIKNIHSRTRNPENFKKHKEKSDIRQISV